MDLVKEKLVLNERIYNEQTQVLVEGDIIVPDVKPDMSVILQTDARCLVDKKECVQDKVLVNGRLEISVLYLAKQGSGLVNSMMLSVPFDEQINIDGCTKDMWVEVSGDITNIDYKMQNDRKINYKAVLGITTSVDATKSAEVVTNIKDVPENQLQKFTLNFERSIENREERLIISEHINVPSGKPNVLELLQCNVNVGNKDVRVSHGKVTVSGDISVTILYRSDNDERVIEFLENELPFNGVIEVSSVRDDMFADISVCVMEQNIKIEQDADGENRVIDIEASLGVVLRVHSRENLEILQDAYCINKSLELTKNPVRYPCLISRNKNQAQVKEVVQIDEECPDILQVLRVKGRVLVDELRVIEDKVLVEGIVEADILYVAESDERPIFSQKSLVPYRQVIETKGAKGNMQVKLSPAIEHVGFNMLSSRELELRLMIGFGTQIIEQREANMITDIEFTDLDKAFLDSFAAMTIYVVQRGDNLWSVAKRYNTSIDDIKEINECDEISAGQKLLILK